MVRRLDVFTCSAFAVAPKVGGQSPGFRPIGSRFKTEVAMARRRGGNKLCD